MDKNLSGCMVSLLTFAVWCGLAGLFNMACANEPELLEIVKKHDEMWKKVNSIQLHYTKHYKSSVISRSFPNCYWESGGDKCRAIIAHLDSFSTDRNGNTAAVEMREDFFGDGKDLYHLVVPQNKYPLTEIRLCDYFSMKDEGCHADIIRGNASYMLLFFPLPRYFFVHTEANGVTLLEIVNKYPSRIISSSKSLSGDDIVEIAIESHIDTHKSFGPWKNTVFINTSKGYNIEGHRSFLQTKEKPPVEISGEMAVKEYTKIEEYWIPRNIEFILHNGEPSKGIRTNFVLDDCKINDTSQSRLNDFCFPTNFFVNEHLVGDQPWRGHIWGPDNKPIRSFDKSTEFMEYYAHECMRGELPQENKYLVLRITLVIAGLMMIGYALYRLYTKDR